MTDGLDHISPAWIGLAAALICLMPRMGLVSAQAFSQRVNFASLFYVAGIIGLGSFVAHSGLGKLLARVWFEALPLKPGAIIRNFASLAGSAALTGMVTTLPGTPAVLTPSCRGPGACLRIPSVFGIDDSNAWIFKRVAAVRVGPAGRGCAAWRAFDCPSPEIMLVGIAGHILAVDAY
jgi:hypothetical protein